ncbi:phosphatase PAP2 family protein [Acidovorax sp. NCPPB 3576]|uniref:phosphatase PAP2 family protein n=1 Tax=Acidovorax sp. NCPPB 3576 TaxID=2940488 RepID=UPI003FA46672
MYSIALGGGIFARVSKQLIERDRPDVERLIGASGFSFPSGHTVGVTLLAAWGMYVFLNARCSRWARWIWALSGFLLVAAVAISRVYMGVHYPSDVVASVIAGTAWTCLCVAVFTQLIRQRSSPTLGQGQGRASSRPTELGT